MCTDLVKICDECGYGVTGQGRRAEGITGKIGGCIYSILMNRYLSITIDQVEASVSLIMKISL